MSRSHTIDAATRISDWLAAERPGMEALLRELVDIDSGSYDKPGIDAVGAVLQRFLEGQGIEVQRLPQPRHGDCLRALVGSAERQAEGGNARRNIVLMGHRDTVFPTGEVARRPYTTSNGRAFGPGVCDMKAGLVMNAYLLAAFHRFGAAPGPMVGLFTGDEEIGSPEGRPVIEAEARAARIVFNSEPGRPTGAVVTGRKGGVFSVVTIEGKAAHSGGSYTEGVSAILELAHKTVALMGLTDLDRGITVNVGLVSGGQSVNTIAPSAEGSIDLRVMTLAQRNEMVAALESIVRRAAVPGTRATLQIKGEFLPMEQSEASARVFELYRDQAKATGFETMGEFSGGCADSGFTAALGAPTLCSVGPVGGKAHSPEEWLDLESMVPRAQALARTILRLDEAGL